MGQEDRWLQLLTHGHVLAQAQVAINVTIRAENEEGEKVRLVRDRRTGSWVAAGFVALKTLVDAEDVAQGASSCVEEPGPGDAAAVESRYHLAPPAVRGGATAGRLRGGADGRLRLVSGEDVLGQREEVHARPAWEMGEWWQQEPVAGGAAKGGGLLAGASVLVEVWCGDWSHETAEQTVQPAWYGDGAEWGGSEEWSQQGDVAFAAQLLQGPSAAQACDCKKLSSSESARACPRSRPARARTPPHTRQQRAHSHLSGRVDAEGDGRNSIVAYCCCFRLKQHAPSMVAAMHAAGFLYAAAPSGAKDRQGTDGAPAKRDRKEKMRRRRRRRRGTRRRRRARARKEKGQQKEPEEPILSGRGRGVLSSHGERRRFSRWQRAQPTSRHQLQRHSIRPHQLLQAARVVAGGCVSSWHTSPPSGGHQPPKTPAWPPTPRLGPSGG